MVLEELFLEGAVSFLVETKGQSLVDSVVMVVLLVVREC
jgi:hypothetical protein